MEEGPGTETVVTVITEEAAAGSGGESALVATTEEGEVSRSASRGETVPVVTGEDIGAATEGPASAGTGTSPVHPPADIDSMTSQGTMPVWSIPSCPPGNSR